MKSVTCMFLWWRSLDRAVKESGVGVLCLAMRDYKILARIKRWTDPWLLWLLTNYLLFFHHHYRNKASVIILYMKLCNSSKHRRHSSYIIYISHQHRLPAPAQPLYGRDQFVKRGGLNWLKAKIGEQEKRSYG